MSTNRHTPGPWVAVVDRDSHGIITWAGIDTADRAVNVGEVCLENSDAENDPQIEADALLMAAAPDMLYFLQGIVNIVSDGITLSDSTKANLRARINGLIAKATKVSE